ncbi:hypothetical protein OH492_09680 [Vibrio chagasii]|nr:hypothetical protein [Vibrio chagasii]
MTTNQEIPNYPAKSVPEGDEIDVEYGLVTDRQDFIPVLWAFAHFLKYACWRQ